MLISKHIVGITSRMRRSCGKELGAGVACTHSWSNLQLARTAKNNP